MCGCLLAPARKQLLEGGRSGEPCQVRGTPCDAYALPPFLLLFSKALLARRLPAVFRLRDGKLTFPKGLVAHTLDARRVGGQCLSQLGTAINEQDRPEKPETDRGEHALT